MIESREDLVSDISALGVQEINPMKESESTRVMANQIIMSTKSYRLV